MFLYTKRYMKWMVYLRCFCSSVRYFVVVVVNVTFSLISQSIDD